MDFPEIEQQISHYGYFAVVLGASLEGEAVLLLSALAAARGLLQIQWVIPCAALGAAISDNSWFWIGHFQGGWAMRRFPAFAPKLERFNRLLARFNTPLILMTRFLYGLRIVGPLAIGMSGFAGWRFLGINAAGCLLWAGTYGALGYFVGERLVPWLAQKHW